jgi:hypothetical protein
MAANGVKKNTFLFTSESVGEGHPDKIWQVLFLQQFGSRPGC